MREKKAKVRVNYVKINKAYLLLEMWGFWEWVNSGGKAGSKKRDYTKE